MTRKRYFTFFAALLLTIPLCLHAQDDKEPKTGGKNDGKLSPATKLIQRIVGSWKIQSQAQGGEVTKNPTSGEWIEFRPDGRYLNRTAQPDSGSYRLNESLGILYLESQVATVAEGKQVTEYNIKLTGDDTMTLQRRSAKGGKPAKDAKAAKADKSNKQKPDNTKYTYVRISQETSSIK